MIVEETKQVTRKIKVLACCNCGSENLDVYNCGYSSFNVAGVKCLDCKNETRISPCDWNISTTNIVKVWNKENDPIKCIQDLETAIQKFEVKIQKIKKLFNL